MGNPHDSNAKIGKDKHVATRKLYKLEHVVNLDNGAIVDMGPWLCEEGDTEQLTELNAVAVSRLHAVMDQESDAPVVQVVVADKGYFQRDQVVDLQQVVSNR